MNIKTANVSTRVIKRFIEGKDYDKFIENYNEHRNMSIMMKPSPNDIRIHALMQKEMSIVVVARKLGVKPWKIYSALSRVAVYNK